MPTTPYSRLFTALDSAGIRNRSDLLSLRETAPRAVIRVPGLMDDAGSWVAGVFTAAWESRDSVLETYLGQKSPRLLADRIVSYRYFNRQFPSDPVIGKRVAYACLFPTRTLFLSHPLVAWPDDDKVDSPCPINSKSSASDVLAWGCPFVPYDFLAQAIELRPLLERGIAYLLPRRFTTEHFGDNCGLTRTGEQAKKHTDIELTSADPSAGELVASSATRTAVVAPSDQVLALPWLYGASPYDTVELAEECEGEFEQYLSALGRYFTTRELSETAVRHWVQEVQYHVDHLHLRYAKKEAELRRKGREVLAGLCFTAAPLLAPDLFSPIRELLVAAWGGSKIKDAVTWLREWRHRESSLDDSEYWFMWKLSRLRGAHTP